MDDQLVIRAASFTGAIIVGVPGLLFVQNIIAGLCAWMAGAVL